MHALIVPASDPVAALAALIPRLTPVLAPHMFVPEAHGNSWAHWVLESDPRIVLRAYAFASDGGGVALSTSGAPMPPGVERDLREELGL